MDDEVVFRNSIKTMINWNEYGFEVCGEASDGLSAKQKIEQLSPDIVITDIKMPGVDGLSVIAFIAENRPDIQIIALSGYDDYEYVRSSLKRGVVDYLLKHSITKTSLLAVLQTAQKRISKEKESQLHRQHLQEQIEFGKDVIRQRFLIDLLEGRCVDLREIYRRTSELALPANLQNMMIAVAEIDGMSTWKSRNTTSEWKALFDKMMELISGNLPETGCVLVPQPDNGFTILFFMQDTCSALSYYKNIGECIKRIRAALKRHYNATACYSISGNVDTVAHLAQAYKKANAALGEKLYRECDTVIYDRNLPKITHREYYIDFHDEQHIIHMLKAGNKEELIDYINNIFKHIREAGLEVLRVHMIFVQLTNLLNRTLREYETDLITAYPNFHNIYQSMQHMTLHEMNQWMIDCYISTMQFIAGYGEVKNCRQVTQQACVYINKNYMKDISLNEIAEEIHTAPSYLSRVFKEDTGKGVVEYLNWVRVEHAKRLINEGVKLNEVFNLSGFNSDTYFYTVFKHNTGKTPKKYKEDLMYASR